MSFVVVIPARYASTRLPGKPLIDIVGKPMIEHVYDRACASKASRVVIATDDRRIEKAAHGFGAEVVMTAADHLSGTDRLEEVASLLGFAEDDIVVNVQGDEPLIPPGIINQVAANLNAHPEAGIATLCERIDDIEAVFNPNVVKVVFDSQGRAMYFSRAPIPWAREAFMSPEGRESLPKDIHWYRHVGLYGYRVSLLRDFVSWEPAPPERSESLEQLRALWHGATIHVDIARHKPPAGVDTAEDLARVRSRLEEGL
ncbi:3-deoxy-manno-octulosonate cytidylyltransferase [Hydrocarboniclastica marina]|uniref:3-deoxy-manno-octulosonate cytidylyltransferase n=1 Tax=Hydrocarboniclastica marina TaxID=2259620 RepID=A0A4P7XH03_9ALTE|nr:3-deoxy-manno-octulosonate cytidylyltransferase [Hydrocarboniclastica marina]QCF26311.1 3-deoxy-manno-octulosonate cytidylyltransferase [Hydrocarboniclastica marina]